MAVDDEHCGVAGGLPRRILLQNTQNRDTRALQLKLDELIRSTADARDQLINLEILDDARLDALKEEFERVREMRRHARADV